MLFTRIRSQLDSTPPKMVLTGIKVLNEPFPLRGAADIPQAIELRHWQKTITFSYSGLHYANPERNTYQYKLEGFDEEWIDGGYLRSSTYTNLDPGHYTFKARAANPDGFWSVQPLSIELRVRPPWWATWWVCGLFAVGLLFFIRFMYTFLLNRRLARSRSKAVEGSGRF